MQVDNPMLRFGDPNPSEDPSQQTEDLGADPIGATAMGLKNLDRVASYLVDACCDEGEDYSLLDNMYGQLIGQRNRELMHVANIVGGVNKTNLRFGDADQIYFPVDSSQQAEAVAFLNKHAFQTPESLINPEILLRLEAGGAPDRILSSQKRLLGALINSTRVKRMSEQASRTTPEKHYAPLTMLRDLRKGIWSELETTSASTDLYRRNLQRAHVEILADQLGDEFPDTDLPALARGELTILLNSLQGLARSSRSGASSETNLHYADLAARIEAVLNPMTQKRPEISASLSPRAGN
jgi:hypothetical protein